MTSGGARVRSGPPPDPNALRRDRDASEWLRLPSSRSGAAPAWPLSRLRGREKALWEHEWTRPQAVAWEMYGRELEVAMYVRALVDAEKAGASVAARTLILRQQDSLGLTIAGLQRNRWIIAADDAPVADPQAEAPARRVAGSSTKKRLEVIRGGA